MNLNEAIIKRINEICEEKNLNVCGASLSGGKSPSAIYDLIKGRTKCSKVSTIKAFCQGAGITLSEFFDKDYHLYGNAFILVKKNCLGSFELLRVIPLNNG